MKNKFKYIVGFAVIFLFILLAAASGEDEKESNKELIKVETQSDFFEWYVKEWYGKPLDEFIKKYGEADRQGPYSEPVWSQKVEIPGTGGGVYLHDVAIKQHPDDPKKCGRPTLCCERKKN
jgi:hypothetical protein